MMLVQLHRPAHRWGQAVLPTRRLQQWPGLLRFWVTARSLAGSCHLHLASSSPQGWGRLPSHWRKCRNIQYRIFFSEVVQVEFTTKTFRTWSILFLHSSFRFLGESSSTFSLSIHHHLSYNYWSFCCCYPLSYLNLSTSCSGSQEHWGREGMWLCEWQCHADHTKTTLDWMCLHKQKKNFIV